MTIKEAGNQKIQVGRLVAGRPIYSKDFKRLLRHDPTRQYYITVNNGVVGPQTAWLKYEELAEVGKLIQLLLVYTKDKEGAQ